MIYDYSHPRFKLLFETKTASKVDSVTCERAQVTNGLREMNGREKERIR